MTYFFGKLFIDLVTAQICLTFSLVSRFLDVVPDIDSEYLIFLIGEKKPFPSC